MKISRKCDYALRALFHLASGSQGELFSVKELSSENDIPRRFLENIMIEMKEQGWVNSVSGREGGYFLAIEPKSLTIGKVVRYFDGFVAPIGCVSLLHYEPCSQENKCRMRRIFLSIRNETARILDSSTIESLLVQNPVVSNEVFYDGLGI